MVSYLFQSPTTQKSKKKKRVKDLVKTGVVYIKHIPHGFYEDEMKAFFSQFGKVLRVCVARSPKVGIPAKLFTLFVKT